MMQEPLARAQPGVRSGVEAGDYRAVFRTLFTSIMLPMFLAVADQTIVATALPAIATGLGGIERASWIIVAYLVAATIAAPVYGRLGDVYGRRRMMVAALVAFMAASVLCALAPTVELLTAMRMLQGAGGGGLMTLSQALIGEAVPPRERARYQGYLAAVAVCSSTFGPVAGGYLTEFFGWPSIFLVNVPIGLVATVLVLRLPAHAGNPVSQPFDIAGLVLFAGAVAAVILGLEQFHRFTASTIISAFALLAVGAVVFLKLFRHEDRASFPLIPMSLLRDPTVWRCDALAAWHGAALVSLITFLPIYLRGVRAAPPAELGLLLLPLTAGIGVGSVITGRIVSQTGCTAIIPSCGLMVATGCLLFLAFWAPHLSVHELPWVFGLNALFMGTVMGVVQVTVQAVAGPQMLGAAAATVQFSRSVGAAFGTAVVGAVLFTSLAASDPQTAAHFSTVLAEGADALAQLPPERQAVVAAEIGRAFRLAFLAVACFTATGVWLAWTMPLRRL